MMNMHSYKYVHGYYMCVAVGGPPVFFWVSLKIYENTYSVSLDYICPT